MTLVVLLLRILCLIPTVDGLLHLCGVFEAEIECGW